MTEHDINDEKYRAAFDQGELDAQEELRARAVRYLPTRDVIEIDTTRGGGFAIPRAWVTALNGVPVEELVELEVWPDGSAIELDARDIQISVEGLLVELLPSLLPAATLASIFARRGGRSTSEAKRSSAQENGKKGGRPRKTAA